MTRLTTIAIALGLSATLTNCASNAAPPPPSSAATPGKVAPSAPLTADQTAWVDSTFASLTLRQKIGQMVMVWLLGDYTNTRDSSFAEVRRWVEADGIGGLSMSLGTPIEVAAKINALQQRAR